METQKLNFLSKITNLFNTYELQNSNLANSEIKTKERVALEKFTNLGLPTVKNEEWKYTNVGFLNRNDFKIDFKSEISNISSMNENELSNLENKINEIKLDGYSHLVFINRKFVSYLSDTDDFHKETTFEVINQNDYKKLNDLVSFYSNVKEKISDENIDIYDNPFKLTFEFLPTENTFLEIGKNVNEKAKLQIIYYFTEKYDGYIANNRNFIKIGANSELEIIEGFYGNCENVLVYNDLSVFLDDNAKINHTKLENFENNFVFSFTNVLQKRDSIYTNNTFALDGNFIRNNVKTVLLEDNAVSNLFGLTLVNQTNLADHHTKVDHYSPNCQSNEFYKTILFDNAVGVFNGKILVRKDAQKTNAYQSSKNILLSDAARMYTKPELEIYADDVKCSHGASTGHIDEEALFYLQARGIGRDYAKSLLLFAFAEEIVEKIDNENIIDYINNVIKNKLNYSL